MTRIRMVAIVIPVMLILSGCTCLTVTKVSPNSDTLAIEGEGQRFSLPRPYIQVTPNADGSISADIIYLPDPEHSYVVESFSFLASDALEVSTEGGIIKTINWTGDSSAVVADAVASGGSAASGILQAEQTKKAEQKAKEDTARKAVDDAQLEFDLAQSTLAFRTASEPLGSDKIKEATLALQAAALKLSAAQAAFDRIRGTATSNKQFRKKEDDASKAVDDAQSELDEARRELDNRQKEGAALGNIIQAQHAVDTRLDKLEVAKGELAKVTGQVFGPKLFGIRDEIRKVANSTAIAPFLEIFTVGQHAETHEGHWNALQPTYPVKWPTPPKPPTVRIFPEGTNTVPDPNNSWRLTLQSGVPLVRLVERETTFKGTGAVPPGLPTITFTYPTAITVNLEGIPEGDYILDLAYQTRQLESDDKKDGSTRIKIKITRKSS